MAKKEKKYKELSPQFIVDETGKRSMVLLKMEVFESLMEDLQDLAIIAERREDKRTSYDEFKQELKRDGRL